MQVVTNFVSNAVKFTPRGGEITISASLKPTKEPSSSGEDHLLLSRSKDSSKRDAGKPHATQDRFNRAEYTDDGKNGQDLESGHHVDSPESEFVHRLTSTKRREGGGGGGGTVCGVGGGDLKKKAVIDLSHPGRTNDAGTSASSASVISHFSDPAAATDSNMTISRPAIAADTASSDAVGASSSSLFELDGGADAPVNNIDGAVAAGATGTSHAAITAAVTAGTESSTTSNGDVHSSHKMAFLPQTEDSAHGGGDEQGIRRLLVLSVQDTGVGIKPEDMPRYGVGVCACINRCISVGWIAPVVSIVH